MRNPRAAVAVVVGLTLAGLVGLAGVAGAASTTTTTPRPRFGPGASGSVAAISGSSMEVQNQQSGQTTVSWTASTVFSQVLTVPASTVTVGDCVTVSGSTANKTITARTVSISQPDASGSCTSGVFGGGGTGGPPVSGGAGAGPGPGGGGFPRSGSGTLPRDNFRRPSGAANFGFASGKVTAVTSSTLTVDGTSSASLPKSTAKGSSSKSAAKTRTRAKLQSTTVNLKLASSTTYSQTQSAAATNLAVGDCVTAAGTSATNGSVTASTVRITSTGGQSCTTGAGGFFGGSAGGGPAGGGATSG